MSPVRPLILFIDAYDSFSNNIISLLSTTLNASIRAISIDNPALLTESAFQAELKHYAAVVCGPGPGHPEIEEDVGIMRRVWRLSEENLVPVLGICLGFQSLCLEFGADVKRLGGPQHGILRKVEHIGESGEEDQGSIFDELGEIRATLYQSLCVDIGQAAIGKDDWDTLKWKATRQCPDLLPLAWVEHDMEQENDSGIMDARVLVAVQHRTKPFWALQYHPESICTNDESKIVIRNWYKKAQQWNLDRGRTTLGGDGPIEGQLATRESLLSQSQRRLGVMCSTETIKTVCYSRRIDIPAHLSVPDIVEAIQDLRQDQIILESTNANERFSGGADVRGRYSIIGLDIEDCVRIEYTTGKEVITTVSPCGHGNKPTISTKNANLYGGIWPYLAQYLDQRKVENGDPNSPFWGGFMGYTTYELGLEGIDVKTDTKTQQHQRPDLCFAWVERSLIVDHVKNQIYLQQISSENNAAQVSAWMDNVVKELEATFLPEESFDPFTITYSNLPLDINFRQFLDILVGQGMTLPCSAKLHRREELFTGFATARYLRHNDPWKIAEGMNGIEISGQIIQAQVKSKITSLTTSCKTPLINRIHAQTSAPSISSSVFAISTPRNNVYEAKVSACQSSIRAGNSYELCLTDQTLVTLSKPLAPTAWALYTTLRSRQPAPFASYIRLGKLTFVSASPERFVSFSPTNCELRPMKGTVRKSPEVDTLEKAQRLLDVPKEKAENLMIVDLVRHDLHGVCGAGNVSVEKLCVVEEYKNVFQMISIVRGSISPGVPPSPCERELKKAESSKYTGLDILAASLPPGSMTGAPKKRSCEILQKVEQGRERSLYSGVVGYADVGGRGDWSVCIRCMFKWEDEDENGTGGEDGGSEEIVRGKETWHIGAGGAVTTLSTPVGEREEMLTKLGGTLGLFR